MKTILSFFVVASAAVAAAQLPYNQGFQYGQQTQSRPNRTQPKLLSSVTPTETVRVLETQQDELALTEDEDASLNQLAPNLLAATTSEDKAFGEVSKVLTPKQAARLEELIVQDLGYGSITLADVRSKLAFTKEQTAQVTPLLAEFEAAKSAILQLKTDATAARAAVSQVAQVMNGSLQAILTPEQTTKLHDLAGKQAGGPAPATGSPTPPSTPPASGPSNKAP